jgi:hypothetical protein
MSSEWMSLQILLRQPMARALDWTACGAVTFGWVATFAASESMAIAASIIAAAAWSTADRLHAEPGAKSTLTQIVSATVATAVILATFTAFHILIDAA